MKKYQLFLPVIIILFAVFAAAPFHIVSAQESLPEIPISSADDVVRILNNILDFVFRIIGVLSVIVILYSAGLFITAGDNQERRKKAAEYLKWGVVGIIVAILAGSIIGIIESVLSL